MQVATFVEIVNDLWFTSQILELKKQLTNDYQKELMGLFLIEQSTIVVHEMIKLFGVDEKSGNYIDGTVIDLAKYTKRMRKSLLKKSSSGRSHTKLRSTLQIDLTNDDYDLTVMVDRDDIIYDIIYIHANAPENFENNDRLVSQPPILLYFILNEVFKVPGEKLFLDHVNKMFSKEIFRKLIDELDSQEFTNFPKSSQDIFNLDATSSDISFLLTHYRRVFTICRISEYFKAQNLKIGKLKLSFDRYMTKVYSVAIVLIGNDCLTQEINYANEFSDLISQKLEPTFFSQNREMRNNIHYKEITNFDELAIKSLRSQQEVYFEEFLFFAREKMKFKQNEYDDFFKWAVDFIHKNGITREHFNDNRQKYYRMYIASLAKK
ncbi:hypothetical protein [Erysipelothrix aquatica]|uniref:hypothetical protein n=1 Tax=Erysipelothrix aquatica TaxID=2683714 RepID=UPI0013571A0E|nr:hypothetical protein [Erysipelothrix aquatica]